MVLANHGHPLSEIERYSWSAIAAFLEDLAGRCGDTPAGGEATTGAGTHSRTPGLEVVEMPRAEYLKHMGITDPEQSGLV